MSDGEAHLVRDGEVLAPSPQKREMPVGRRFQPGNPGRPKGSRNKLGEAFISALCADFQAHGARVIERVREEEPGVYLRVIARIVPPAIFDAQHGGVLEELSDEELGAYLMAVREALRGRESDVVDGAGG
jgi:hypothetical protein